MNQRSRIDITAEVIVVLAFIAIFVLKITGILKLSWWIILAPFWMSFGVGVLLVLIVIAIALIKDIINIIRRNIK